MTSAFYVGLMTNRAARQTIALGTELADSACPQFLAEWQTPVPLDVIFDSPNVNWSYSSFTQDLHPILGRPELAEAAADLDSEPPT